MVAQADDRVVQPGGKQTFSLRAPLRQYQEVLNLQPSLTGEKSGIHPLAMQIIGILTKGGKKKEGPGWPRASPVKVSCFSRSYILVLSPKSGVCWGGRMGGGDTRTSQDKFYLISLCVCLPGGSRKQL